jgi:hypothetical protein
MIESIKLLIAVIVGVMEALPQTDAAGKIPDAEYNALVVGAVTGAITGAGFQVTGFSDAQIAGVATAFVGVVRAYKAAVRVAA